MYFAKEARKAVQRANGIIADTTAIEEKIKEAAVAGNTSISVSGTMSADVIKDLERWGYTISGSEISW